MDVCTKSGWEREKFEIEMCVFVGFWRVFCSFVSSCIFELWRSQVLRLRLKDFWDWGGEVAVKLGVWMGEGGWRVSMVVCLGEEQLQVWFGMVGLREWCR